MAPKSASANLLSTATVPWRWFTKEEWIQYAAASIGCERDASAAMWDRTGLHCTVVDPDTFELKLGGALQISFEEKCAEVERIYGNNYACECCAEK